MKRKIYNDLIKWKEQTSHKPLMILGVRQCGKTYIINEFCQNEYKNVVQINLLQRDDIVKLYETDLTSDEKFNRLKLILNSELEAEDIIFFIDEIQYMKSNELGALIAALHRANQLGYPVMIVGAGLPKIYSMLSEEKSYSERLFVYKEIGSLEETQAREAIEKPAEKMHVRYTDDAVTKIIRLTKGYPFFIQQLCQIVYQNTSTDVIDGKCVEKNVEEFLKTLDNGFFKVRYERCSEADKKFIFAMTACGELPCTISSVAKIMNKTVNSISTSRAQLISKGIIYSVRYKELDFTVPEFDAYVRRLEEYREWKKENKIR